MQRVVRESLGAQTAASLALRQADADRERAAGSLDIKATWSNARRCLDVLAVLDVLKHMAGPRERCMYCLDSHATDIEHFWPKTPYPEQLFEWLNLLLCCTECGRFKGERFPLDAGQPLLVDPTRDDPWQYLDFEPQTGIVMARFERIANRQSPKGVATVDLLQLNQREALSRGYLTTYRRLCAIVEGALAGGALDAAQLLGELRAADDHGLLGWCFSDRGRTAAPFSQLHGQHRSVWDDCAQDSARP